MRTCLMTVVATLTLAGGPAVAQDWSNVKSWTGTVKIEASETKKQANFSSTMTYRATGDFTISDDALPAGSHVQWPFPNPEKLTDPNALQAAYERWQSHVVASYEAKGVDENGEAFAVTCAADNRQTSRIGVASGPMAPNYVVNVSAPDASFKCSGRGPTPDKHLPQRDFELNGPKAPGPVTVTKVFNVLTTNIKIAVAMAPSR